MTKWMSEMHGIDHFSERPSLNEPLMSFMKKIRARCGRSFHPEGAIPSISPIQFFIPLPFVIEADHAR